MLLRKYDFYWFIFSTLLAHISLMEKSGIVEPNISQMYFHIQLRLPSKPLVIGARCGANASALMMDDGNHFSEFWSKCSEMQAVSWHAVQTATTN